MPKYILSKKAERDLRNIWFFTSEKWSDKQADKYIREIKACCVYLTENPKIGKLYEHIISQGRRRSVKSHLVFYQIEKTGDILIDRILHQKMDVDEHLKK